jgi:hypothetical protein
MNIGGSVFTGHAQDDTGWTLSLVSHVLPP